MINANKRKMTMTRHHHAPQITELDRMLLRERGWSYSESQENILAMAEPRPPGRLRLQAARVLRTLADWADARRDEDREIAGRPV
ncbi:MAG: hypothetical protein KDK75_04550 [Alphaproteobacteria bacterium]|nr:hypothetical protein [Alphaproteobacteria bacterium]